MKELKGTRTSASEKHNQEEGAGEGEEEEEEEEGSREGGRREEGGFTWGVLCSLDLDVLRAQRIMSFCFILITHRSMSSENPINVLKVLATKAHFHLSSYPPHLCSSSPWGH